ncbi:hypothetical protein Pint_16757 [Pistacia integerrima]|uniref:Uncharacterized protein n=1 Tax=Pistacia integerrima TaxID=434235 RepID=A0ACC0ZB52_9ROSI|nr:hypothetical protein Pint_16757 [Pistacia integerrima]
MRATPLAPFEWRKRLEAVKDNDEASNSNLNTNLILLYSLKFGRLWLELEFLGGEVNYSRPTISDVLNQYDYEWDIGHFDGARRPDVDCFRSTSFGQSQSEALASDPLANVDKEKTDILMYCTEGIRCDTKGFRNFYTLKGGVSHYLKNEGPVEWVGNLFMFDSCLSLPPATYKLEAMTEARKTGQVSENPFATCYICNSQISDLCVFYNWALKSQFMVDA